MSLGPTVLLFWENDSALSFWTDITALQLELIILPVSKDTGQGTQFKGTEGSESSLLSVLPEPLHIPGLGPQQGRSDS